MKVLLSAHFVTFIMLGRPRKLGFRSGRKPLPRLPANTPCRMALASAKLTETELEKKMQHGSWTSYPFAIMHGTGTYLNTRGKGSTHSLQAAS